MAAKFDPSAFLAAYGPAAGVQMPAAANIQAPAPRRGLNMMAAVGGADFNPSAPASAPGEEPGLLEATGRGVLQGLSLGFADEISGVLESAFTDKKYAAARDESRQNFKAAKDAHPIGYGLGEVLGAVGTGVATGGVGGAAVKLGTKGVAALAGAEGAIQGIGSSEGDLTKGEVGTVAKDALVGGVIGAGLGAVMHKAAGKFIDTAEARNVEHITKDLTKGATPTESKRFAKGVGELAADVLEKDTAFMRAAKKGPGEAMEVTQKRLDDLSSKTAPIWEKLDAGTGGGVPLTKVTGHFDQAIDEAAGKPGLERLRDTLTDVRDNFQEAYARKLKDMPPEADIPTIMVPHKEVRQWVTRLLKSSTQSMGGLNDTAVFELRSQVYDVANTFLRSHLDEVAESVPGLAKDVGRLRELNREIRAYAGADALLDHTAQRELWKKPGLGERLDKAGAVGLAGLSAATASPLPLIGGAAFKVAAAGVNAGNKLATRALARLQKAIREKRPSMGKDEHVGKKALREVQSLALDAIRAGVPMGTVQGALGPAAAMVDLASDRDD